MDEFDGGALDSVNDYESIQDISINDIPDMPDDLESEIEPTPETTSSEDDVMEEFPDMPEEDFDESVESVSDLDTSENLDSLEEYVFPDMPDEVGPELEPEPDGIAEVPDMPTGQVDVEEPVSEEVVPPDSAYEAFNNFAAKNPGQAAEFNYMSEHNYGLEDRAEYSKDPEYQELDNDFRAATGMQPIDYGEPEGLSDTSSTQENDLQDLPDILGETEAELGFEPDGIAEASDVPAEQVDVEELVSEEVVQPGLACGEFDNFVEQNPAQAAMTEFMNEGGYTAADMAELQNNPEHQRLNNDLFVETGRESTDHGEPEGLNDVADVENDAFQDALNTLDEAEAELEPELDGIAEAPEMPSGQVDVEEPVSEEVRPAEDYLNAEISTLEQYNQLVNEGEYPLENDSWENWEFDTRLSAEELLEVEEGAESYDFNGIDIGQDVERLDDCLSGFEENVWESLTIDEQKEKISALANYITETLELDNPPNIEFYFTQDSGDFGGYSPSNNTLSINEYTLSSGNVCEGVRANYEAADTVAHELWHAYQHQGAENPSNIRDIQYRAGFDNYVSPSEDFGMYQSQLVESEARAFAAQVKTRLDAQSQIDWAAEINEMRHGADMS